MAEFHVILATHTGQVHEGAVTAAHALAAAHRCQQRLAPRAHITHLHVRQLAHVTEQREGSRHD